MEAFGTACLVLSIFLGETLGYEIQPVDAVLIIDGAPTYLRMTNSTSLENVYACVLENSENVNSVITATQMKGVIMDVGQVEDNVNDSIRRISANAARAGQSAWRTEEELKMLKSRLARYLAMDYYGNGLDPEAYFNYKSQRSTDRSPRTRGQSRFHSRWRDPSFLTPGPRRQLPARFHEFLAAPETGTPLPVSQTPTHISLPSFSEPTTPKPWSITSAETREITITRSFEPSSSTELISLDEYPKMEPAEDAVRLLPETATVTSDEAEFKEDAPSGDNEAPSLWSNAEDFLSPSLISGNAHGSNDFGLTLTKGDDSSDWSSAKSSEDEDWEDDDRLKKKRKKGKSRNSKKRVAKVMKKRRLDVDGDD